MIIWNPWHGCHKVSEGCQHCYMYFLDRMRGIDTSKVSRNANFDMPLKRGRDGRFKVPSGMELTARMTTNYRQLKTIYRQRKDHRLPEWREFCRWLETLPHSEWITRKEEC